MLRCLLSCCYLLLVLIGSLALISYLPPSHCKLVCLEYRLSYLRIYVPHGSLDFFFFLINVTESSIFSNATFNVFGLLLKDIFIFSCLGIHGFCSQQIFSLLLNHLRFSFLLLNFPTEIFLHKHCSRSVAFWQQCRLGANQ